MIRGQVLKGVCTLELIRNWVRTTRKAESYIRSSWWPNPLTKMPVLGKRRRVKLLLKQDEFHIALSQRYEGIMNQLVRRAKLRPDGGRVLKSVVWQNTQSSVRTLLDYRRVPSILWENCASIFGSNIDPLKHKFMLRAFVEEFKESKELGALLTLAFGSEEQPRPDEAIALQLISDALRPFHKVLLDHSDDLKALTGGTFSKESIRDIVPPFSEYEEWLFRR